MRGDDQQTGWIWMFGYLSLGGPPAARDLARNCDFGDS